MKINDIKVRVTKYVNRSNHSNTFKTAVLITDSKVNGKSFMLKGSYRAEDKATLLNLETVNGATSGLIRYSRNNKHHMRNGYEPKSDLTYSCTKLNVMDKLKELLPEFNDCIALDDLASHISAVNCSIEYSNDYETWGTW